MRIKSRLPLKERQLLVRVRGGARFLAAPSVPARLECAYLGPFGCFFEFDSNEKDSSDAYDA